MYKRQFESYEIESMDKESIRLKNGIVLESELLPDIFGRSFELGFIVATLKGYDELDAAEENMLNKLFLDNWGLSLIHILLFSCCTRMSVVSTVASSAPVISDPHT